MAAIHLYHRPEMRVAFATLFFYMGIRGDGIRRGRTPFGARTTILRILLAVSLSEETQHRNRHRASTVQQNRDKM